jgi:hypothetical protein
VDQVHLHTLLLLVQQCLGKLPANVIIIEDVGFQVDVVACFMDGFQHGRVGVWAILQQPNGVAGGQGAGGDRFFNGQMALENVGVLSAAVQAVEHLFALGCAQGAPCALQAHCARCRGVGCCWHRGLGWGWDGRQRMASNHTARCKTQHNRQQNFSRQDGSVRAHGST